LRFFVVLQLISLERPPVVDAGSTVDAMSDAIEGADVMLYGVSLACKSFTLVCHLSKSPQVNSGLCVYFATDKESANVSALSSLHW
jgi:hypothetical protein